MLHDLLMREMGARRGAAARITDHRGEVADDEDRLVAQFLKLAKLGKAHRVAEMNVGRGGIDSELHPEGTAQREFGGEFLLAENLRTTAGEVGKLFGKPAHVRP